jgi:hypothetical protein
MTEHDYVSVGPWTASQEWPGKLLAHQSDVLCEAVAFAFGQARTTPEFKRLFDARGVMIAFIHDWGKKGLGAIFFTDEVLRVLGDECSIDTETLRALEVAQALMAALT